MKVQTFSLEVHPGAVSSPWEGDGHVPHKSCIISSKKNNPKASSKIAEQLRLAFFFFFFCKYKIKKDKAASIWKKNNHPLLY